MIDSAAERVYTILIVGSRQMCIRDRSPPAEMKPVFVSEVINPMLSIEVLFTSFIFPALIPLAI